MRVYCQLLSWDSGSRKHHLPIIQLQSKEISNLWYNDKSIEAYHLVTTSVLGATITKLDEDPTKSQMGLFIFTMIISSRCFFCNRFHTGRDWRSIPGIIIFYKFYQLHCNRGDSWGSRTYQLLMLQFDKYFVMWGSNSNEWLLIIGS